MGSNKNEPRDIQFIYLFIYFTIFLLQLKLAIQTSISVNHYHLFTLRVFDYSYTHIRRVDTVRVIYVYLSENSHEDALSLTHRCTDTHALTGFTCVHLHDVRGLVLRRS